MVNNEAGKGTECSRGSEGVWDVIRVREASFSEKVTWGRGLKSLREKTARVFRRSTCQSAALERS